MIDPLKITNFNRTDAELEEVLLFWICVAGKKSTTIAHRLDTVLYWMFGDTPFEKVRGVGTPQMAERLKNGGIGCYKLKARSMRAIAKSGLNLRTCSAEDLMGIYGIGFKTARCFLIHSRRESKYAGLDTHILHYLYDCGYDCPLVTPSRKKEYLKWEKIFLSHVEEAGTSVAEMDLAIWTVYSQKDAEKKAAFIRIYESMEIVGEHLRTRLRGGV